MPATSPLSDTPKYNIPDSCLFKIDDIDTNPCLYSAKLILNSTCSVSLPIFIIKSPNIKILYRYF